MSNNPIKFKISLSKDDWDKRIGWTSDALNLPGVVVEAIFYDNRTASPSDWRLESGAIQWNATTSPPESILVTLRLTTDFTELERAKLQLESDKVQIEREKKGLEVEKVQLIREKQASDERWKVKEDAWKASENRLKTIRTVLLGVSTVLGIITTYFALNRSSIPVPQISPTVTSPVSTSKISDWLICWHGKALGPDKGGYEYLIAYPPNTFQRGLDLSVKLSIAPGVELDTLANDSLKMCYLKGKWYGGNQDSMPWFPRASYLKVEQDRILLYDDVSAQGDPWIMKPGISPSPSITSLLKEPSDSKGIQVLKSRKTNSSGN
jgi:hypothetical protein